MDVVLTGPNGNSMFDLVANGRRGRGEVPIWRAILGIGLKFANWPAVAILASSRMRGIWFWIFVPFEFN
jgi:hypothetical protein